MFDGTSWQLLLGSSHINAPTLAQYHLSPVVLLHVPCYSHVQLAHHARTASHTDKQYTSTKKKMKVTGAYTPCYGPLTILT